MGLASSTAAAAPVKGVSNPDLFADLPATFTANGILAGRPASLLARDQTQAHAICASAAAIPLHKFDKEMVHDTTKRVLSCATLVLPETAPPLSTGARDIVDHEFLRRDLLFVTPASASAHFSPTAALAAQHMMGAAAASTYLICAKTERYKL